MSSVRRARQLAVAWSLQAALLAALPIACAAQTKNPFQGSTPAGQAASTAVAVSLSDAFARALKYNLGSIESGENVRAARAARLRSLNALLPNLAARLSGSVQQINLRAQGFSLPSIPGAHIPTVVGPFGVSDVRAYLSQEILGWSDIEKLKSASQSERASRYSYRSDRDTVVFTAGGAYLLVISDQATVDSIRAQVHTAETLVQYDTDQNKHGLIAAIDLLRARVELQTEQQRLIAAENQTAIDKLALARVIGLPNGQAFELTDSVPYAPLAGATLGQSLQQAYAARPDYRAAQAAVRAAELAARGAGAENYPTLATATNYGDIGSPNLASSHGTFAVALTLNVPLFQGSLVRADKLQADAALADRRAELADLGGLIDQQVRTAFFNLQSSSELVAVARSNIDLANQTLTQAQDRFRAGVADNLEVVQAQESVATANQSYIASLYSFNLAKLSLSLATGVAEQSALQYLGTR